MTEPQIKIMKLSSGEEVVSELISEENSRSFNVRSPLKLIALPKIESGGFEEHVSLQRWIHFAEEKDVSIPKIQVLAIVSASVGLSKFYEYCVHKLEHQSYADDEYSEEDDIWEDDEEDDLLDYLEPISKLIH